MSSDRHILWSQSPSWKSEFGSFVMWGLLCLFVVGIPVLLMKRARLRITHYRVFPGQLEIESGIVGTQIQTLDLWRVAEVRFAQTFGQRLLGIGTVQLSDRDDPSAPGVVLRGVQNPRAAYELLRDQVASAGASAPVRARS
jgi:uncharacterized membrane protein YdbT with pleckstrin-like domain